MTAQPAEPVHDRRWFHRWLLELNNRYRPDARIVVEYPSPDLLILAALKVDTNRGCGIGHMIVTEIVKAADEHGVAVACNPTGEWGSQRPGLMRWFHHFGFAANTASDAYPAAAGQALLRPPNARVGGDQGAFRLLRLTDGSEIEIPAQTRQPWLPTACEARALLDTLTGLGLRLETDWWHRVRRGSVRLLASTPDGRIRGAVTIGAASGSVRRGHLRLPALGEQRLWFGRERRWRKVLLPQLDQAEAR